MRKIEESLREFFEHEHWSYDYYEEKGYFRSGVDLGNILGNVNLYIIVGETDYQVYSVLNLKVEPDRFAAVSEFITRANYGLRNGNFELDYADGEVRYKVYITSEFGDIPENIVRDSIYTGIYMIERYGRALLRLILIGGDPAAYIQSIENPEGNHLDFG